MDEMAQVGAWLWQKGWAERNAGNISINITRVVDADLAAGRHEALEDRLVELAGASFAITAAGSRLRDLGRDPQGTVCLLRVDETGQGYYVLGPAPAGIRPTSELASHLRLHRTYARQGQPAVAVLHTHPTELVALTHLPQFQNSAVLSRLLWSMHPEAVVFLAEGVAFAPFTVPGTAAMGALTAELAAQHRVVVWEKHGCLAVAPGITEAFDLIDTANKAAQLYLLACSSGQPPQGLSEAQITAIRAAFGIRP